MAALLELQDVNVHYGAICALEVLEPWAYGVATVIEGEELRDLGVSRPIVIFTPLLDVELTRARSARLTPTLGFPREIEAWLKASENTTMPGISRARVDNAASFAT